MGREHMDRIFNVMEALPLVRIRYDPADAYQNRIFNEDNPKLPFEVDLNEGT